MKPFIIGKDITTGRELSVDPNHVRINEAGTNMTVATYSEKDWDRGSTKPVYLNYAHLHFSEEDRNILINIFKAEKVKKEEKRKKRQKKLKKSKKNAALKAVAVFEETA